MKFAAIVAGVLAALWIAGTILTAHALHHAPDGAWWTDEDDDALEALLSEETA